MFLAYAIVGSLVILAASSRHQRRDQYRDSCVAAGLCIFCIAPIDAVGLLSRAEGSRNYDWALYCIDTALHLDSRAFAVCCYSSAWVRVLLSAVYLSLPLAFAIAWLLSGKPSSMLRVMLYAAVAGCILYALVPACGPSHVFVAYPYAVPELSRYALNTAQARNAMPSLHLTWALLLFANAQGRWLRAGLFCYAIFTGFATVGGGEHYFIDLIAAVPFTALVQHVTEIQAARLQIRRQVSQDAAA